MIPTCLADARELLDAEHVVVAIFPTSEGVRVEATAAKLTDLDGQQRHLVCSPNGNVRSRFLLAAMRGLAPHEEPA